MNSKEIIIMLIGLILSIIVFYLKEVTKILNKINLSYALIFILTVIITILASILYMRLREAENDIIKQQEEQNELKEKLKRYEELINIKVDIKELQRKVFKK